jgi:hypothetical protein
MHIFLCAQYVEDGSSSSGRKEKSSKVKAKESSHNNTLRIQDKELLEMTDEGRVQNIQCCVIDDALYFVLFQKKILYSCREMFKHASTLGVIVSLWD